MRSLAMMLFLLDGGDGVAGALRRCKYSEGIVTETKSPRRVWMARFPL
jgi:hypothetical protein